MSPEKANARQRGALFGNTVIVLFLLAQVFDGAFTYLGVHAFGRGIEANPLLAWLMGTVGPGPALAAVKAVASVFGAFLHLAGVHLVVAFLTVVYLAAALVPWATLLFFH
jgi:uncharacterized membrane protein